ncbi:MAG: hypothetical protein HWN68_13965 [Desulfobacterales bacterium]|nr:hypothetical protein [Desulfobacterales bacterium]
MIYIAKKHSRIHFFPGDVSKEILQYYRDRKWRITLDMTRSITELNRQPKRQPESPAPQGKPIERRKRRLYTTVMGRRVLVE